jgi:surface carbohydrate biosynthesis protein
MKNKRYLLIPIETKVRELHAKFYMACVAAERGFTVVLGGSATLRNRIPWLPCGALLLDKSVAPSRAILFRNYRRLGMRVVAWCEEGLVIFDREEYLRRKIDRSALSQVELFFAWGKHQADLIRQNAPESKSRVVETGNPRIDLLSPRLRAVFSEDAEKLRKQYTGLILFNTNFSQCNHQKGGGAFVAGLKAAGKIRTPEDEAFAEGRVAHKRAIFNAFREALTLISREFPDAAIVVRPHPSENHETWRRFSDPLPNVEVLHKGGIVPWLCAARVIIHNGCTTGLEGRLLGRPVIAFRPVVAEAYDTDLPNQVSLQVFTLSELTEAVQSLYGSASDRPLDEAAEKLVAEHIHKLDGSTSDLIADFLWGLAAKRQDTGVVKKFLCRARRIAWRILTRKRIRQPSDDYVRQKFPGLTTDELSILLGTYQKVAGRFKTLAVEKKWEDCFVISREER